MKHNKKIISKNICEQLNMPMNISIGLCNSFINTLIQKSKTHNIKIHRFGTFYMHQSPKRLGRNPKKTEESYIIQPREKLCFKSSEKVRKFLN